MKICTGCEQSLPLSEFHRSGRTKDGHQYRCKSCASRSAASWYKRNRERHNEVQANWRRANPGYFLGQDRLRLYGLTEEKFESLLASQGYACAVCKRDDLAPNEWCVDHDHSCCSGKKSCGKCVRGLLCRNCNTGLGHFKDDPQRLLSAVKYLEGVPE